MLSKIERQQKEYQNFEKDLMATVSALFDADKEGVVVHKFFGFIEEHKHVLDLKSQKTDVFKDVFFRRCFVHPKPWGPIEYFINEHNIKSDELIRQFTMLKNIYRNIHKNDIWRETVIGFLNGVSEFKDVLLKCHKNGEDFKLDPEEKYNDNILSHDYLKPFIELTTPLSWSHMPPERQEKIKQRYCVIFSGGKDKYEVVSNPYMLRGIRLALALDSDILTHGYSMGFGKIYLHEASLELESLVGFDSDEAKAKNSVFDINIF